MSNLCQHNLFMSVVPHTTESLIAVDANLPPSMYYAPVRHQDIFSSGERTNWFSDLSVIAEDRGITSPYDDDGS